MRYNERIREIREDNALTQQNIADLLHVGQRTYSDYESGKTRIPLDSLLLLARFYNVSVDYISGAAILLSVDLWKQIGGFDAVGHGLAAVACVGQDAEYQHGDSLFVVYN